MEMSADTTGSWHSKYPPTQLKTRFDLAGTGSFATADTPVGTSSWILPGTGTRRVAVQVRDPVGHTAVAGFQIGVPDIFAPPASTLSASQGGTVWMRLTPGPALGGSYYVVFGTVSGTSPGTAFEGGINLPINIDVFSVVLMGLLNVGPFQGFVGTIQSSGFAMPVLQVPVGMIPPGMVGTRMHFAALDLHPQQLVPRYASNAVEVKVVQ
jgi:hypothetical protein